jgi:lipid II:glycine glycyltransferase (peptidoglycan interpeptide bridge formation enzyme)
MGQHIVQSPEWGDFKTKYGTPATRVGDVQYTKHRLYFLPLFYAYSPKVDPFKIRWEDLLNSLKENNCIAINFDVPNVIKKADCSLEVLHLFEEHCVKAPRDTFAKYNVLLDISVSEEDLLRKMHTKHRYNLGLAQRKGVTIKHGATLEDFEVFYKLQLETSARQKFYIHPKGYYQKIWELMYPKGMCHILTAYYQREALASWMLFTYEGVLYYPYGGSSEKFKNVFASTLVAWEAIKLGKSKACHTFDMWGASKDPYDTKDPWYGFTNFKLKFGGEYVEYVDSYDFVVNKFMYFVFNLAQKIRWKILRVLR